MNLGEGIAASLTGSKNAFKRPGGDPGAPVQPLAPLNLLGGGTRTRSADQIKQVNDEVSQLYGGDRPQDYLATINNAYVNLGQPAMDADRNETTNKFITSLASTFADKVYERTGQLPTEDQMRSFVASNANSANASRFIQGQLNTDQMYNLADTYVQSNPDRFAAAGQGTPESRIMSLNDQLDKAYNAGAQNYINSYDQNVYNPSKTRTANDLAGQGMLTQPNSRYSLDQVEANRSRDISSGLNTLAGQRAAGSVDLGKTIEDLLQKQQGINNQQSQFNQTLQNQQNDTAFNQGYLNRGLSLSQQLGKLQAQGQENNGIAGGLGGALQGAGSGFQYGGGLGAAIGGLGGGLLGYFGSKR